MAGTLRYMVRRSASPTIAASMVVQRRALVHTSAHVCEWCLGGHRAVDCPDAKKKDGASTAPASRSEAQFQ
eukprot:6465520-Amphidinium_carterae.2